MKICSKCRSEKSLSEFTSLRRSPDGKDYLCRACKNATKRAWAKRNKEHIKEYNKSTRHKYPYNLNVYRRRTYGVDVEAFQKMLVEQNYKCALCGINLEDSGRVCLDHDHETNQARSILCITCNTGLGMFHESAEALRNAANYLDYHQQKHQEGEIPNGTI